MLLGISPELIFFQGPDQMEVEVIPGSTQHGVLDHGGVRRGKRGEHVARLMASMLEGLIWSKMATRNGTLVKSLGAISSRFHFDPCPCICNSHPRFSSEPVSTWCLGVSRDEGRLGVAWIRLDLDLL